MMIVKIGGSVLNRLSELVPKLIELNKTEKLIIVHGGAGQSTNILANKLGVEQKWLENKEGQRSRYTDKKTIDLFVMAVMKSNMALVAEFSKNNQPALGMSGFDNDLIKSKRRDKIAYIENGEEKEIEGDYTGTLKFINTEFLLDMLRKKILPVIAPVSMSFNREPLNVDGDKLAVFIAEKIGAKKIISISDVPGVLNDSGDLIATIDSDSLAVIISKIQTTKHTGGMRQKLFVAKKALRFVTEFQICGIDNFMCGTEIKK